jgi:hypothetical protein
MARTALAEEEEYLSEKESPQHAMTDSVNKRVGIRNSF